MVTNKCVIDCSIAASWIFKNEYKKSADLLLQSIISEEVELIQPNLWWYEMLNLLKTSLLRKRIQYQNIQKILFFLKEIPMTVISSDKINEHLLLENAVTYDLSAYDSAYLTLAETHGAKLFTFDKHLLKINKKFNFICKP